MSKKISVIALTAALAMSLMACNNADSSAKKETSQAQEVSFPKLERNELEKQNEVVTYKGGEVSGKEFADYLAFQGFVNPDAPINEKEFQKEVLNHLVMEEKITQEVKDDQWASERADELWEQISASYDEKTRKKGYETLSVKEETIKNHLLNYYKVEQYFREGLTDKDIQAFYEDVSDEVTGLTFQHILVATKQADEEGKEKEVRTDEKAKKIADDVKNQLDEGGDFSKLAEKYNEDPGSKKTKGVYEQMPLSQLDGEFRDAAANQKIGEIGEPVKTDYGYHIIRVDKRQKKELKEVKDPIMQQLAIEKMNNYMKETLPSVIKETNI
ncbi:peptidylprolyl isomerase [Metabacillus iocasae]|uniref:Parvulin-like peptidyl-prolyl isomerase n=1 Tax=Priestia iocasae TaxID=2291674 RepID=A0ABS2QT95_9BACI|nr:peptidylprolyl isomerase [Metabacillus iocasae]MBM7702177.1 parvulin-like peptidyl-prolyl isomerase [Metabacillus iocasae]